MIFETHAHYDDERFDEDREETIARVRAGGVSPIINVGASIESTRTTLALPTIMILSMRQQVCTPAISIV